MPESSSTVVTPRVKVCCISSVEEAQLAIELGASGLGLVSEMPSGPGVISEDQIRTIARRTPPGVSSFLLTCLQDPEAIIAQHRRCGTSTIQICDSLRHDAYEVVRAALPGISLVQVIHVRDEGAIEQAGAVAPMVDAILLDSGNQSLPIKELGGAGRVHDWTLSRRIVESVAAPVFLAGGLRPDNVRRAVDTVAPFGLDLCSGVRRDGRLDRELLAAFMSQLTGIRSSITS
ncbi:MAG: phosphoribosylanthranilate isomerase [Acidobacteria bacterium]|nr:phosphoribosylanthranilate isomerase [Acidobacteriota bacterium]